MREYTKKFLVISCLSSVSQTKKEETEMLPLYKHIKTPLDI